MTIRNYLVTRGGSPMTRDEAVAIALKHAKAEPDSVPPHWLVDAILEAAGDGGGFERIVKANHPSNARAHVESTLVARIEVRAATQDDLERLLPKGVKVETA